MQNTTTITIRPLGLSISEDILLTEDDCFELERGKIVIKHDKLVAIATGKDIFVDEIVLDAATYCGANDFSYIYRARAKVVTGETIEELGEANPANLETPLSKKYPALMAHKRAQDRLILRLLGISGEVYSDTEIPETSKDAKPLSGGATKPESKTDTSKGSKSTKTDEKANEKKVEAIKEKVEEKVSEAPAAKVEEKVEENKDIKAEEATPEEAVETATEPAVEAAESGSITPATIAEMSMDDYEKALQDLGEVVAYNTPAKFGPHKEDDDFTLKDLITNEISSVEWVRDKCPITDKSRDTMKKIKLAVSYLVGKNLIDFPAKEA